MLWCILDHHINRWDCFCLFLRLSLVPVLSFKNSKAPLLSVEFRYFCNATFNYATVAVGNQGFLTKEITFLKEKGKKKKLSFNKINENSNIFQF